MNFIILAVFAAIGLSLAPAYGDINKIDATIHAINQYKKPITDEYAGFDGPIKNNIGGFVWGEHDHDHVFQLFYWDEEFGVFNISEAPEITKIIEDTSDGLGNIAYFFFDENENLFICIRSRKSDSNLDPRSRMRNQYVIWNKKNGFTLLNIQGFSCIWNLHFSGNKLVATGDDELGMFIMGVITPTNGFWPWESAAKAPVVRNQG